MAKIYKGKIINLHGSYTSNLAVMTIKDVKRGIVKVPCDNAPTVRALDDAFYNVIGKEHTINNDALAGKMIFYTLDDLGILSSFSPASTASDAVKKIYKAQK